MPRNFSLPFPTSSYTTRSPVKYNDNAKYTPYPTLYYTFGVTCPLISSINTEPQHGARRSNIRAILQSFLYLFTMVLLALRWKGEPKSPELAVDPSERLLDIYVGEQMTEEYLQKNWKGQVPCLLGPQSFKCDDSLDITLYLGERYPRLLPRVHSRAIKTLLYELHQIWFVSLSFRAEEGRGEAIVKSIHHLMSQPTSSDEYKAALQKKLEL